MAHISVREGSKVKSIYLREEEKERLQKMKKTHGLRSLGEAYRLWKEQEDDGYAILRRILADYERQKREVENRIAALKWILCSSPG